MTADRNSSPAEAEMVVAALAEFGLQHTSESEREQLGRRSAVRGIMVRLGLYDTFCKLLADDATDDEVRAALTAAPKATEAPGLREALEPFAELADQLNAESLRRTGRPLRAADYDVHIGGSANRVYISAAALMNARAALSATPQPVAVPDDGAGRGEMAKGEMLNLQASLRNSVQAHIKALEEREAERAEVARLRKDLERAPQDERDRLYAKAQASNTQNFLAQQGAMMPHERAARSSREEGK